MSAAFSFGSVGDIITLCQLSIQLSKALSDARGSAKEYRELRRELDCFVDKLAHVIATFQQYENSPALEGLDKAAKRCVDECTILIQAELDRLVPRYDDSLGDEQSASYARRAVKKIQWSIIEKEDVARLRAKLSQETHALTMLVALATFKSTRVDNQTMLTRIYEVGKIVSRMEESHALLANLQLRESDVHQEQCGQLAIIDERLIHQDESMWTIVTTVKKTFAAIVTLKDMIQTIHAHVVQQQYRSCDSNYFAAPDPTLHQPITLIFENEIFELPYGFIRSWVVSLTSLLTGHPH
ncbi:hypothetical protein F4780DRAFT_271425 [Xylariomycetidae sp. FL0641]|nr:hypothetical protein F4780DRAFT_271425 [Xylariomycetidae sp. FL0641]